MKLKLVAVPLCVVMFMGGTSAHAAMTAAGDVFVAGDNRSRNLGVGTTTSLVAGAIDTSNLGGRAIKQVAAGFNHSLLLAQDGTVFSFGDNAFGLTGLGAVSGHTLVATPIDTSNLGGRAIKQVAAGGNHSLLLAEDGTVFAFGDNSTGELGLGTFGGSSSVATPIDTSNLGGRAIAQVAAGVDHSLLLAEDGTVFSFGANFNGQTGLGTIFGSTSVATPIDTSNLGGRVVTQVAAGGLHSLLLAEDGTVFSFGDNNFGATGLGAGAVGGNTTVATPIDTSNLGGRAIKQVAAGGLHSLLLAEDGTVFAFGDNNFNQGAVGIPNDTVTVAIPSNTSILGLGGRPITQVAAGNRHSLLIAVPEPASITLIALGGLALLRCRRRGIR